jgi:hypothetical protein
VAKQTKRDWNYVSVPVPPDIANLADELAQMLATEKGLTKMSRMEAVSVAIREAHAKRLKGVKSK